MLDCIVVGAELQEGASQRGCLMGPDALRTAGLVDVLSDMGLAVEDRGNVEPVEAGCCGGGAPRVRNLSRIVGWTEVLIREAEAAASGGAMPIFIGGDHSLSHGTVAGMARHARREGRPLFVLWLDAHPDLHSPDTTESGNLHGTPVGYFTGQSGFDAHFPAVTAPVDPANVCFMGLRSVDPVEKARLREQGFATHDMRAIDEAGVAALLLPFLEKVRAANGMLHVSLDVDFLDPGIAPAVGTTVPGGASFREAHLIMELLHESGLVASLDLVELNPFLDERGRTAKLMVDLTASLMGRTVLDRPTRSF